MIEGTVEALDEDGLFIGWLRDTRDALPALVQIRLAGAVVAEALASSFRPDLLRGGHGHGHYGFRAKARVALPPGGALFTLFLPRHGQGIPVRLNVPALPPPAMLRVEALLQPDAAWTGADLAGAVRCLDLPAHLAAMGARRFVDVCFRLVLHRWPLPGESVVYVHAIADGSTSADELMTELLQSRERADLPAALASPWDASFPFAASSAKERA